MAIQQTLYNINRYFSKIKQAMTPARPPVMSPARARVMKLSRAPARGLFRYPSEYQAQTVGPKMLNRDGYFGDLLSIPTMIPAMPAAMKQAMTAAVFKLIIQ